MRGENTLEITLKGTEGQARKILSEIETEDQQIKADKAEGTVELSLKIPGGTDPREEIFYACVKENCPILKMETKHVSLEDIFLELTSQDASAVVSQKGKKEPEEEKEPEGAVESIEEAAEASGMFATSEETVTEEEQDHEDNL